jgi:hypothetical protein
MSMAQAGCPGSDAFRPGEPACLALEAVIRHRQLITPVITPTIAQVSG